MRAEHTQTFAAKRVQIRSARNWIVVVSAIAVLLLALAVSRFSLYRPINGDEAYNLQIAKSVGLNFCYCTSYLPEQVFPVRGSSNGIIMYVGGLFFAFTHNPDTAKAGTAAAAILLLGAALFLLDSWLVLLTAFLFFVWWSLDYVSINFLGELWAIAFSLLGIASLRRCNFSGSLGAVLASRTAMFAILYFGIAVESKLVAALVVLPITWVIAYQRDSEARALVRALRASCFAAVATLGTALALLLLIAFSVTHSVRAINPSTIWQIFSGYIFSMTHFGQGQAQPFDLSHVGSIISHFDSPIVLALLVLSAAILLYANWAYALFLAVTFTWWLHYGVNERHVVISLYVMIILAGLETRALVRRISSERSIPAASLSLGAAAATVAIVVAVGLASHSTFYAPARDKRDPNRERVVDTSEGRYHYRGELVDLLRRQRYVVTSGSWQFAELTIRQNLEFYDRMSRENAGLPRDQVVLLFDTSNPDWPATSVQGNCDHVLYTDGPLVLCAVKRDVPLNFQPAS